MARPKTVAHFHTLDLKEGGPIVFDTAKELADWLQAEVSFWGWAAKNNPNEIGVVNHERRDIFLNNSLRRALNEIQAVLGAPNNDEARGSALAAIAQYADAGLVSTLPRAKFINSLRELPNGDIIAQSALATYLGEITPKSNVNTPYQYRLAVLRGRAAIVNYDAGISPSAADKAREAFEEIGADNKQLVTELLDTNERALASFQTAEKGLSDLATKTFRDFATQFGKALDDFANDRVAIAKRIDEAHARYTTAMEIQAPVDYWTTKHKEHKRAAWWWGFVLSIYAIVGSGALGTLFYSTYWHAYGLALSGESKFNHLAVLLTAAVVAGSTIAFWIARFLSRLFLSERHMAIDAKQRATMAKTYLALASNQQITEKDRALVLTPLFRPSSDGLIQEETGLEGVASTLARVLDRR